MARSRQSFSKPALLCIVPPYSLGPPAGVAYLLAYARQQECHDFGFVDLRLGVPDAYAPTYAHTGVFGESYVMDVPDLPLVLSLAQAIETGADPASGFPLVIDKYCGQRGISVSYLSDYLVCLDKYFSVIAEDFSGVRFIGCSVWTSNFLTTLLFAAHLKRLRRPPIIVGGGPQLTESYASAAIALRSRLLDYVITGEGEVSLLDLYSRVSSGGSSISAPIPGTLMLDNRNEIQRGTARKLLSHNEIPVPAFDDMPLLSYEHAGQRTAPYHLSRGCTDKCVFCSEWTFWQRFRPDTPNRALAGIQELQQKYGVEYITFTDSLLNGHPDRLREFAEGMTRIKPLVSWGGFMRADMNPEMAALLRTAGCDVVFVGVESMSDETLALMNKRRTELQNIRALRAFLGAGIRVVAGLIPGFPGDPREAFLHTVGQLRDLQQEFRGQLRVNVEPFIVSPGQPIFSRLEEKGLRGVPWEEEILDIAPQYKDITTSILCAVNGDNQGVERMGKLRIAEAIRSDDPIRTDPFAYQVSESLERSEFDFQHLTGGWFIARLKSPASWIYAMIVNERERGEIEAESLKNGCIDILTAPGLRTLLKRLETAHLLQPQRVPVLTDGGYSRFQKQNTRYQVAPYIVSRLGDWRVKNRLFVVDFATTDWCLLSPWQGEVLKALQHSARNTSSLQKHLARKGVARTLTQCARLLQEFTEKGIVLTTQSE